MKNLCLLALINLAMSSCSFSASPDKTIILVHAQWHGAWCWNKIVPLLEARGIKTIAFDLPGHGQDSTPVEKVLLKTCVEKVVAEANRQPGQVLLLGHSSGGIIISQAAEFLGPAKVSALVFLDAFLPGNGESVFSLADKYATAGTPLGKSLIVSKDHITVSLNPDFVGDLLYHDCAQSDIDFAKKNLRPGPLAILATPVTVSAESYGRIRKFYILCTKARDMEKSGLSGNVPCEKIYPLPSSHSPFFSEPDKLAEILAEIKLP
jgi:alpha-beta hydrolase superfamily lysophospholipase